MRPRYSMRADNYDKTGSGQDRLGTNIRNMERQKEEEKGPHHDHLAFAFDRIVKQTKPKDPVPN